MKGKVMNRERELRTHKKRMMFMVNFIWLRSEKKADADADG